MKHRTMLEWALFYADHGLAVVPIKPGSKRPDPELVGNAWQDKATTDPVLIRAWWSQKPECGIGCVTGAKSGGVVVTDEDFHPERGINGPALQGAWEKENEKLPTTWIARSGSGGIHRYNITTDFSLQRLQHLYFMGPDEKRSLAKGQIDFQAGEALIVMPPTIHPETGKAYEWLTDPETAQIAPFNGAAKDFIDDLFLSCLDRPHGEKFELTEDEIATGGRTAYLISHIGSLQARGVSDRDIVAAIRAENENYCNPPLTDEELDREVWPALKRWEKGSVKKEAPQKMKLLRLDEVEEQEAEWLIPGYIPKGQITVLAAEGGTGKTSLWCNIAAAVSSGQASILDSSPRVERDPGLVMFFSAEDSVPVVLARRLRKNGANMSNFVTLDATDESFSQVSFDGEYLEKLLAEYRPALCIFDPIQSFVPGNIKMGERNAMRQCLEPLIRYGGLYGTSFMIIVHTNKQAGVYGRKRIADSSDIWDIARSVLIAGSTGEKDETGAETKYLSHEKCNYGPKGETIIFRLADERVEYVEGSDKKDKDFILGSEYTAKLKPQRDAAKDLILDYLDDGQEHETGELATFAAAAGISKGTLNRAKADLKKEGAIIYTAKGSGSDKKFYIHRVDALTHNSK